MDPNERQVLEKDCSEKTRQKPEDSREKRKQKRRHVQMKGKMGQSAMSEKAKLKLEKGIFAGVLLAPP